MANNERRQFRMPHTYVIIFCIIILAALLTYIIPAGSYDRVVNEQGRTVVVDGSFHFTEQHPIKPFDFFQAIVQGYTNTADIIFFVIFAFGWVNTMLVNGTFNALMGSIIRKFGDRIEYLIPVLMILFGIMGSTIGISEETHGLMPVFAAIGVALGYDAIVGVSMVYIGVQIGFASATMNPFTIGVASGIAEIPYPYGLAFRIFIFCVAELIGIIYVMRYARKVKADPTKSLVYGTPLEFKISASKEDLVNTKVTTRHKLVGLVFVGVMVMLVIGTTRWGWYIQELSALFIVAMLLSGFLGGMNANQIAQCFVQGAKDMMFGAMIIGLGRGIVTVLSYGGVIDTVIYGVSKPLMTMAASLGAVSHYVSAIGMVFAQNIFNFFIGSGSGQASAVMPIMTPIADIVGVSRTTAALAFTFGDGYSNMFWPTGVFTLCGLAGLPVDKWYKYIAPLFGLLFCMELVMICVAVAIGF